MSRMRCVLPAALAALVFTGSEASAGDRFGFGFSVGFGGRRGGVRVHAGVSQGAYHSRLRRVHRVHRAPRSHCSQHRRCARVPVYRQVWVPPRYEKVFVGHDSCGRPVYRTCLVRAGYYRKVFSGYRCSVSVHRY